MNVRDKGWPLEPGSGKAFNGHGGCSVQAFGGLRYAAIPHERAFGFQLIRHDQYMTANPLCRIPKPPQMRGLRVWAVHSPG